MIALKDSFDSVIEEGWKQVVKKPSTLLFIFIDTLQEQLLGCSTTVCRPVCARVKAPLLLPLQVISILTIDTIFVPKNEEQLFKKFCGFTVYYEVESVIFPRHLVIQNREGVFMYRLNGKLDRVYYIIIRVWTKFESDLSRYRMETLSTYIRLGNLKNKNKITI